MSNDLIQVSTRLHEMFSASTIITDFVGKHKVKKGYNIYFNRAVQDHGYPCLIFVFLSAPTERASSGRKIFAKLKFAVKLVTEGDSIADTLPVLNEIERLCTGDQMTTDTVIIGMSCYDTISYPEVLEGGKVVNHTGFLVEIFSYNTN